MGITKVWIEAGCISCGVCEACAPEVFEIKDIAFVKKGINFNEYDSDIKEASQSCPVEVIKYE
jgi:ferredoxin